MNGNPDYSLSALLRDYSDAIGHYDMGRARAIALQAIPGLTELGSVDQSSAFVVGNWEYWVRSCGEGCQEIGRERIA